MSLTPEALYYRLGSLVAEAPDLATDVVSPETDRWIERAAELVEMAGGLADKIQLRVATENLNGVLRARNARPKPQCQNQSGEQNFHGEASKVLKVLGVPSARPIAETSDAGAARTECLWFNGIPL